MAEHQWKVGDTFRCVDCAPKQIECTIWGVVTEVRFLRRPDTLNTLYTGSHWGSPVGEWESSLWDPDLLEPRDWPDEVLASYTAYRLVKGG